MPRSAAPGLPTPHPIADQLPGVLAEDDFTRRFTQALDEVLAPVQLTLDGFVAYLDPALAPPDFLDWLAGWVALPVQEQWTVDQRRVLVAHAVELHRWRGTRHGLATHLRLLTGGRVEVADTGGTIASVQSTDPAGAPVSPHVTITVAVPEPSLVDESRLRSAAAEHVPAHVPFTLRVERAVPSG
ncbi:phage tail protein [Glycomyces sp. NPDC049804]|uniref:phage tail protein n=1 Tax=Glycomyces sp. NPDC049804 TaxID=3154363 RepID=UPI00343CA571